MIDQSHVAANCMLVKILYDENDENMWLLVVAIGCPPTAACLRTGGRADRAAIEKVAHAVVQRGRYRLALHEVRKDGQLHEHLRVLPPRHAPVPMRGLRAHDGFQMRVNQT